MRCKKCKAKISKGSQFCGKCGEPVRRRKKRVLLVLLLAILATAAMGIIIYIGAGRIPRISNDQDNDSGNNKLVSKLNSEDSQTKVEDYIPDDDSISFDEDKGLYYADNELLVVFVKDLADIDKATVIDFLGGKVVGKISELNMYQIVIEGDYSLEELSSLADELMARFDSVLYATYDTVTINQSASYSPNDPWDNDVSDKDWTDDSIDGSNWWIEAISAQDAWDHQSDYSHINIGICDSSFDVGHEDLKNRVVFPNEMLESRNVIDPWWIDLDNFKKFKSWSVSKQENYHGTHVAGIIGAEGDNKKGITGILQNCTLLLAPYYKSDNMEAHLAWDSSTYANLSYLVQSGAKVVNFSQGKTNFLEEGTGRVAYTTETINREGHLASIAIAQLIKSGHEDFLVVQSAGNGTGDTGLALDAIQNGWFASITDSSITGYDDISIDDVRSHVIIVGAADERTDSGFQCESYSNYGSQVSVCAPGAHIYSTVPGEVFYDFELNGGYGYASGTSMAAPIVTGVCGLTWAANPRLSAKDVKEIVCSRCVFTVAPNQNGRDSTTYNMVNANLSVEAALSFKTASENETTSNSAVHETSSERDIVLVLDVSGSMAGEPLEATKNAASRFVDVALDNGAQTALVAYDDEANTLSQFSTSEDSLRNAIGQLDDGGGTDMESGLASAQSMLAKEHADKQYIVLMSDGQPNEGKTGDELVSYAESIRDPDRDGRDDIIIYTLGFNEDGEGERLLRSIASDGCYYSVRNLGSLDELGDFFLDMADSINGVKFMYARVACPVDVSVTFDGETLDSAGDNPKTRASFGSLTFEDDEGGTSDDPVKVLRLREGQSYDISIKGTGFGTMDYSIGFIDDEGIYSDFRTFSGIEITDSTAISTTAETAKTTMLAVDEDGDGTVDKRYRARANQEGELVDSGWVVRSIVAVTAITILILVGLLLYRMMKKHIELMDSRRVTK